MPILIAFLIGAALGALASYLALRNNPRTRAKLDAATDKAELKIEELTR